MEPMSQLKRPVLDINYEQCIIFQAEKKDKLRPSGKQGLDSLKEAVQERLKRNDEK